MQTVLSHWSNSLRIDLEDKGVRGLWIGRRLYLFSSEGLDRGGHAVGVGAAWVGERSAAVATLRGGASLSCLTLRRSSGVCGYSGMAVLIRAGFSQQ